MRYIQYDDPNHKCDDYGLYADAIKNGIIIFKEGKIKDFAIDEPLKTIFERRGMKKLMEVRLERNFSCSRKTKTYIIEIEYIKMKIFTHVFREVTIREAIRRLTRWDNLVDAISINAYLINEHKKKESYNVLVEIKRGRINKEQEVGEPTNKKKAPSSRNTTPRK